MTVKEFAKLADAIKTYFPRDNMLPTDTAMELWYDMLKDMDYKDAYIGLKNHVATSRFAPTIADIRNGAVITQPEQLNEMEAWALVAKALRNGGYHSLEEYEKLPSAVQKAVGTHEQLRNWAMDENFNEEVAKSNFLRAYRIEIKREQELVKMPNDIKELVESVNQNSYKAQIEVKRQQAIKISSEREESEIKALEDTREGVEMPERYKQRLEDMRNKQSNKAGNSLSIVKSGEINKQ